MIRCFQDPRLVGGLKPLSNAASSPSTLDLGDPDERLETLHLCSGIAAKAWRKAGTVSVKDDVRFDTVLRWHVCLYYGSDWRGAVDDHVVKNAHQLHALQVKQAALEAITLSVQLSGRLKIERARHFILYGVTRRLEMIWHAYHDLLSTVDPKRETPLCHDESIRLMGVLI
jgi:hypothetical protein